MKKKNRAYGASSMPYFAAVSADWKKAILAHTEGFPAALYRPGIPEVVDVGINKPMFGALDDRSTEITYQDPVIITCVKSTGREDESFLASWEASESMGYGASAVIELRASEGNIADGSIIEFLVANAAGGEDPQRWYVVKSNAVGTPAIGFLHYLIPCGDCEQLPDDVASFLSEDADSE